MRADHLSAFGYYKCTSPNIDRLAQEGVIFTNTFSQASITLPSVASIFSSVYPYSHRLVYILKDKMPDKISTIAQVLNIYGYDTVWFGKMDDPHSGSARGLLKGFNEKFNLSPWGNTADNENIFRWIRSYRKSPFFITIHSYSVHEQFFPFRRFNNGFSRNIPKNFLDLMDSFDKKCWDNLQDMLKSDFRKTAALLGEDWVIMNLKREYSQGLFNNLLEGTKALDQKIVLERIRNKTAVSFFESFDKKDIAHFLSLLDSAIFEIDKDILGVLTEELKELNIYDKTVIIITADHGNLYGEHGKFGHGYYLYDEVMRVPLILHLPKFKGRRVVEELVQSIDIFPTVLDLLSIPAFHQAQGISLAGLIEGKEKYSQNEYVFCEPRGSSSGPFAIRSKDWKLMQIPVVDATLMNNDVSDRFDIKLFDLKNDPGELHDLAADKPKVAEILKNRLDSWKDGLFVYQEGQLDFIPGLQEETKERIRKTGYW